MRESIKPPQSILEPACVMMLSQEEVVVSLLVLTISCCLSLRALRLVVRILTRTQQSQPDVFDKSLALCIALSSKSLQCQGFMGLQQSTQVYNFYNYETVRLCKPASSIIKS